MQNRPSSRTLSYDAIVVGAGGIGAAAAYHLALNDQRILLLEQYQIGNKRSSSHGESRIIRYAHDESAIARLMPQTFELWRRLEKDSNMRTRLQAYYRHRKTVGGSGEYASRRL